MIRRNGSFLPAADFFKKKCRHLPSGLFSVFLLKINSTT
jgi:hypothetical protein